MRWAWIVAILVLSQSLAWAGWEPDYNRLADAIYKAEGGARTRHPYGIMERYKHTTPREACINTLKHKYRDWVASGSRGDYLEYLAAKYAPVGCDTDNGTNHYWLKNVRYHLARA